MTNRRMPTARQLVGRRIVGFEPNPYPDGRGGTAHNPTILLDDGSRLAFVAEDTEDQPGVFVLLLSGRTTEPRTLRSPDHEV
jgi:hypothetical protein